MKPFRGNIEKITERNRNFRRVLYTVPRKMQLVVMSLLPQEEIGEEVHKHISQFIRIEHGRALVIIGKSRFYLKDGDSVIIPPNTKHNVINRSKKKNLQLYTIYTPPEHKPNTIEKKKYV